jgi:phosphoglycolate phosphatase-like HAD superfamily hydrolase
LLKAIVFDFDGVILESAEIKTAAFRDLFADYPDSVDRIVEFHTQNAGISRFEKFKVIYRDFLCEAITPETMQQLGERFSRQVFDKIMACPMVEGVRDFLETYQKSHRLFICSGTPQTELREIVRGRGLEHFFTGVYGSPSTKTEILAAILKEHVLQPAEVAVIGDAMTDLESARLMRTHFVGRVPPLQASPFPADATFSVIPNFTVARAAVESLTAFAPSAIPGRRA